MGLYVVIAAAFIIMMLIITNIRIVPQSQAYVIERLGTYAATWQTGLHVKMPLIDKMANHVSLKEKVLDFPPQPVITKDNVTMKIDTVVYMQITDPKLYTYGVENPLLAIENLSATTLRNIIGELDLDATLTSRDVINTKMRAILDEATDPWGIKVNRVEVKNIMPPEAIREAMEKQMRAERERREKILIAEGQKQSEILVAEGKKQSMILQAEAEKESTILKAQAEKEAQVQRAQGEAQAIREAARASIGSHMPAKELELKHTVKLIQQVLPIAQEHLAGLCQLVGHRLGKVFHQDNQPGGNHQGQQHSEIAVVQVIGLGHQQIVGRQTGLEQAGEIYEEGNAVAVGEVPALQGIACHGADEQPAEGAHCRHENGQPVGGPDAAALDHQPVGFRGERAGDQGHAVLGDVRLRLEGGAQDHQEGKDTGQGKQADQHIADPPDHIIGGC